MNKTLMSQLVSSCLVLLLGSSTALVAQGVAPNSTSRRGDLPIGSTCTAEVRNITAPSSADGRVSIPGVVADRGLIRLRATCTDAAGNTSVGESTLRVPIIGGETIFDDLSFGPGGGIPQGLQVLPHPLFLSPGGTQQLTVTATLPDSTVVDVTAAPGTIYRSSREAVATVDAGGLVTAVASGSTLVMALNEGKPALALVTVLGAPVASLEAIPDTLELTPHLLFPAPSQQLQVRGRLADATTVDFTAAATGTTYVSSNPSVVQVTPDGLVVGIGGGSSATITVANGIHSAPVVVDVGAEFVPAATVTYDTPGFAENVDIDGGLIYVADGNGGLGIYDFETGFVARFDEFGGRSVHDVSVRDGLVAVGLGGAGGIALVDASDPSDPALLSLVTTGGTVLDLWLSGDRLYVAAAGDLDLYDVGNPAAPGLLGSQSFGATVRAVAGDSSRNLAVALTTASTLEVVRTDQAPWSVASLALPSSSDTFSSDVALLGNSVYVANGRGGGVGRLHKVDIGVPDSPSLSASTGLNFIAYGVAVRNTERGPLVGASDLFFVNSAPLFNDQMQHIHNVDFPGDTTGFGIAFGNGFGAVAGGSLGIQLFGTDDVTDNRGIPPTVTITEPLAGAMVPEGVAFEVHSLATDDLGVDRVELLVDGLVVDVDETEPWVATHSFADGTTGAFDLRVEAIDGGGNRGVSQTVTVDVVLSPAVPGAIDFHQKITDPSVGGQCALDASDQFGVATVALGDLDGAGASVQALAVGALADDDGGSDRGAVCILFLDAVGSVISSQKISDTAGAFSGGLDDFDFFGASLASLGDLDGDGVPELAVGAHGDDDGAADSGAVWVLFLNGDGTVKSHQKISATSGGFTGLVQASDQFGIAVASLGNLDGSALTTLAVGANLDDDASIDTGAVWVLFLNPDGTVDHHQKISATEGGFTGILSLEDYFGSALASMSDFDGDAISDLAVGALGDGDGGGLFRGAVWILFLNPDGTVKGHQKISNTAGGLVGPLDDFDLFGSSLVRLKDLNGDGVDELAVGAFLDDDGGADRGAVWILFLDSDGTVQDEAKLSSTSATFPSGLSDGDNLGTAVAAVGDLNGDGVADLVVGADHDDTVATDAGAVWIFFLDGVP